MGLGDRVQGTRVLDRPPQRNHIAHGQTRVELGDRLLDEEIGLAAHLQAHAHVVAQVDEFGHAARKTVGTLFAVTIEAHPLRARTLEREFGVAVWQRTNGAALYTGNATYAAPTIN